ncbi:MAG TPA: 50S ribosomal protein L30 [Candidatus Norongarragalinales archaeon]|nr:50S ribosomal protein L30 [Candidatus Norongarragalinales archaeon]
MSKLIAIVRIRGSMETRTRTEDSIRQLKLTRANHCTLVIDSPSLHGILITCKDFLAWGEAEENTAFELLAKKGELEGGKKLTDAEISKRSKFKSIAEFSQAFFEGKAKFSDVLGLKPLFRLHPARKGFGGVKLPYPSGALGNRGEKINALIQRML